MTTTPETCWTTTVLSKNIHCASCISYIKDVFAKFGQEVYNVNISILCQTVEVQHCSSLCPQEICLTLAHSAFDVLSASTNDDQGRRVKEQEFRSRKDGLKLL